MPTIEFTDKDHHILPNSTPTLTFTVDRYGHEALGGPKEAVITAFGSENDLISLIDMLRYGINIYNDSSKKVWWGMISSVQVRIGWLTIDVTVDKMSNRVSVVYNAFGISSNSPWYEDDLSIAQYGTKEIRLQLTDSPYEQARQYGETQLKDRKYPVPDVKFESQGEGGMSATIYCRGWYSTLDWIYYTQLKGLQQHDKASTGTQRLGAKLKNNTITFIAASTITDENGSQLSRFQEGDIISVMGSVANDALWEVASTGDTSLDVVISSASIVNGASGPLIEISSACKMRQGFYNFSGSAWNMSSVHVQVQAVSTPDDSLKVTVYEDSGTGCPGATIATGCINSGSLSSCGTEWTEIVLNASAVFDTGQQHWLEFQRTTACPSGSSHYVFSVDEAFWYTTGGIFSVKPASAVAAAWRHRMPRAALIYRVTGTQETSEQIREVVATAGQFINAIDIAVSSSISTNQYRNGDKTALAELKELLESGTLNGRRMLAYVDPSRRLKVYEEPPYISGCSYNIKSDLTLYTPGWSLIEKSECVVGQWLSLTDIFGYTPKRTTRFSEFFIEEAEYFPQIDVYAPRSRNARDPWGVGQIEEG